MKIKALVFTALLLCVNGIFAATNSFSIQVDVSIPNSSQVWEMQLQNFSLTHDQVVFGTNSTAVSGIYSSNNPEDFGIAMLNHIGDNIGNHINYDNCSKYLSPGNTDNNSFWLYPLPADNGHKLYVTIVIPNNIYQQDITVQCSVSKPGKK